MSDAAPSAAERGDTVPRWVRVLVRLLAVGVFVVGTLVVALVKDREPADESAQPTKPVPSSAARSAVDPLAHAAQQVRLLDREDERLRTASQADVRGLRRVDDTLVLGARRRPWTLADLLRGGAATRESATVVTLDEPVTVRRDAQLEIISPGTTLRLRSSATGFASLVSWGGSITLSGKRGSPLVVAGWDTHSGRPDRTTADGRAYIRVKDGDLRVAHATLRDLGFWSGRTGGLALTGSIETVATATLDDVTLDRLHLGLYVSGADRVRASDLRVRRAEQYGVEVTNRSEDVRMRGLLVHGAGQDGLSVSNGSSHVVVAGARVHGATGYGIDVDGTPLADGPNSAGYALGNYAWIQISGSRVTGNDAGGVRVESIDHLGIEDCRVQAARSALVVAGPARDVTVAGSRLASQTGTGLVLSDAVRDAGITGLTVTAAAVGIDIADSTATVDDSTITVGTGHGIRVSGHDAEATLTGATINGRGSGAVDSSDGATVTGGDSVAGDWTYRPEIVMWAEDHAAAMPLLLVLVVPVAGLVFVARRRRQQRELRRVFEATLVARGRSAIEAYPVGRPAAGAAAADAPGTGTEPEPDPGSQAQSQPAPEPEPEPEQAGAATAPAAPPAAGPVDLASREFTTARDFALAAVLEAGYPPHMVARVLHVPTSRVRTWLAEAEEAPGDDPH